MNYKKISVGLLLFMSVIAIGGFISADEYPIQKIAIQLDKWRQYSPVEKVYLQFDKPYYAVGDDILVQKPMLPWAASMSYPH